LAISQRLNPVLSKSFSLKLSHTLISPIYLFIFIAWWLSLILVQKVMQGIATADAPKRYDYPGFNDEPITGYL
jgi:hypothetical protein